MKIFLVFVTIIYFLFLFYIVLFTQQRLHHLVIAPPHFIPFESTINGIFSPPKLYVKAHYIEVIENFTGNILLFMPFGFLFSYFLKNNKQKVLILAFFISLFIESMQLSFSLGVFDVDDIMLNVSGAWLGISIFRYAGRKVKMNV
jgi:glycopeptide antibiotics resistance protein